MALIISIFILTGCTVSLPDKEQLIEDFYSKRVGKLFDDTEQACKERAILAAENHVDSLVDQWINADFLDTLAFPPKPVKPEAPEAIIGTVERFDLDTSER